MVLYESMSKLLKVSKVIFIVDNEVLLLQQSGDLSWELPGGRTLPEETFKKAAKREVKEETGLKIQEDFLVKLQTEKNRKKHVNIYMYTHPVNKKIKLSNEHVNYKWVTKSDLDSYKLSKSTNHLAIISAFH